ncbi:lysophospholipid acyltransferase family protein [Treponema sp.]|uniref:lysophospholipid acyltransferase family protein n=1 Tax=Treponema sp. TaxID=166 RepID=UPI00298DB26D|nr:lysophospholipid acyltransferase family protein [Treponema sp.]MCR5613051.1 1-acyl-sn-glycerol-3-phosphate acyltransferase [Treponema sp.]
MNFFDLAGTTPDVLEKIAVAEKEGRFSDHLDPLSYVGCLPVDENFPYIPGPALAIRYWWRRTWFLKTFNAILNRCIFKTKVFGKENLKGIKGAVYTCNHVNKFDGLVMIWALQPKKIKIMTADFNNREGMLGDLMRADGILPFKNTPRVAHKFNDAVKYYLKKGTGILFFPEASEWWCYERPRPLMDGAYHYAVNNNVPVVPAFITFKLQNKFDANGIQLRQFNIHFLKPIYPDPALDKKANIKRMHDENEREWWECYEQFYGKSRD